MRSLQLPVWTTIAPTVDRSASSTAAAHTFHKLHSLPFEILKGEGPGLRVAELKELESDILNTLKFCRELLKGSNEVQASGFKLEVQLPYWVFWGLSEISGHDQHQE